MTRMSEIQTSPEFAAALQTFDDEMQVLLKKTMNGLKTSHEAFLLAKTANMNIVAYYTFLFKNGTLEEAAGALTVYLDIVEASIKAGTDQLLEHIKNRAQTDAAKNK